VAVITLSASDIDLIKIAAFIAPFFINRQAAYILALHLCWEYMFIKTDSGLVLSICAAILYFIGATVNIKLKSEIRQALWLIGFLYWLAALDYYVSDAVTYFYLFFPHLINAADLFILYHLISRGRQYAGFIDGRSSIVNRLRVRL